MNILIDAEEAFDKIQHSFLIKQNKKQPNKKKPLYILGIEGNFSQPEKRHLPKTYS